MGTITSLWEAANAAGVKATLASNARIVFFMASLLEIGVEALLTVPRGFHLNPGVSMLNLSLVRLAPIANLKESPALGTENHDRLKNLSPRVHRRLHCSVRSSESSRGVSACRDTLAAAAFDRGFARPFRQGTPFHGCRAPGSHRAGESVDGVEEGGCNCSCGWHQVIWLFCGSPPLRRRTFVGARDARAQQSVPCVSGIRGRASS